MLMSDAIVRSRIAISLVCLSLDACPGLDGFNRVYESWRYFWYRMSRSIGGNEDFDVERKRMSTWCQKGIYLVYVHCYPEVVEYGYRNE